MLRSSSNAVRKEVEESGTESDHQEQRYKQVFVDEHGNRICFMIHKSIRDPFARGKLERDIERHGGVVLPGDEGVDTVIVDDMRVDREALQLTYDCHPEESKTDIWVEPMSFIGRCIRYGVVEHRLRRKEGMGGRLIRTAFTAKDEEHLCKYLAIRIPEKAAGGRVGLGVYLQMQRMAAANPQTYPWVKRHPPDSWRERYKNNQDRLDEIITHYVEHRRPTEKQKYHRDRRVKRQRPVHSDSDSTQGDVEIIDVTNELLEATNTRKDTKSHRRRRSDRDTRPVKRQRSVPSLDLDVETEKGVSPPYERSKGKERALSPEVVEEDSQKHSSLFSEDEFDQPGSLEPGSMFPHNSPSDRIQGALPSSPPCLTQTTLVATIPPSRPQPQPSMPIGSLPEGSLRRASTPPHVPNAEQVNTIPPPPAASGSSPRHRPAVMGMARRHKVPDKQESLPDTIEAPYRNTRSRSRSIQPSVLHSQNPTREPKGKQRQERLVTLASSKVLEDEAEVGINDFSAASQRRKKKRKEIASLEPLQEMLNEDDAIANFRGAPRMAISVRDSLLDERDVVDSLAPDFIEEGTTLAPDDIGQISEVYFDGDSAQRRGSLDADDKQTDNQLRQPPAPSLSQHPRSILHPLMDPQQALQIFNASMPHPTRRPSNAPVLPVAPRPSQSRLSSASSAESYPLTGTRAHTVKESIKEEEKSSPYRPPTGTKAARYKRV